jgi:anti-sigma B factor antagonist
VQGTHPNIVVTRDRPPVVVIALQGEHDQYSAPQVSRTISDELGAGHSIVVDLAPAIFVDSTTAGALLVGNQRAVASDRRFVVLLPPESGLAVQRLFETARLGTILTVVADREGALELAGSPLQSEA